MPGIQRKTDHDGLRINLPPTPEGIHASQPIEVSLPITPLASEHQRFASHSPFYNSALNTPNDSLSNSLSHSSTFLSRSVQSGTVRSGHGRRYRHTVGEPLEREWTLFGQVMESGAISPRISGGHPLGEPHTQSTTYPPINQSGDTFNLPEVPDVDHSPTEHLQPPFQHFPDADDYDSDSDDSGHYTPTEQAPPTFLSSLSSRISSVPPLHQKILKCALAYFVASLFTFSPFLSSLISDITTYGPGSGKPLPSGHMVATIVVYFAPSTTKGGMLQADLFCLCGLLFAGVVCLLSMAPFWWLELQPGWEWAGDAVVILWIGVSMSMVAWMKVWMANPSFNTACSMTSIILFVVIVKEGGLQTLTQVAFIVLCGSITTNLICYSIWPQTATVNLQVNMSKTLDSFSTILTMLTETFLLERGNHHPSQERIQKAVDGHQSSFTGLKKSLDEAKSEWMWRGREGNYDLPSMATPNVNNVGHSKFKSISDRPWGTSYEDAVDSLTRLAQHLNGLRSGTRLQYELSKVGIVRGRGKGRKEAIISDHDETAMLQAAAEIFGELVDDLGPPLKALSNTCTMCFKRLQKAFAQSTPGRRTKHTVIKPEEYVEMIESIEKASHRFESTSNHAMLRFYRKSDMSNSTSNGRMSLRSFDEDMAGSDNEHVFLVYFFIFTLQEFSGELISLIDAMSRVSWIEQERAERVPWWRRFPRLRWPGKSFKNQQSGILGSPRALRRPPLDMKRSFTRYIVPETLRRRQADAFPKIRPHAPNTLLTPARADLTFTGRMKQRLWALGNRLRERDSKYAIKAGMATAILAAPAFFDSTRPVFTDYFGQWALISFFVVMSPTIGATNYLSLHRIIGTIFGASVAVGVFSVFAENPAVLSIFGFFFSLPCFYYICSQPKLASSGRFVLLTYNLTCLYSYNLRQHDVPVVHIAIHRVIAVTAGVVWAALVSRFWWPSEARRELGKALGDFCLNLGWLYMKLVASNSYSPEPEYFTVDRDGQPHEQAPLITSSNSSLKQSIRDFMSMELHLQIKLIELQGLLAQTQHEPRLKGPFPVEMYRSVLTRLQTILDKLHSMRCVTTKEEWYTNAREDFVLPVNKERREMVGNIVLGFAILSSSFRLKAPLPPYLPPAEKSRQRLVEAIRKLDIVKNREAKGSKHLLYFAYAITMKGVTQELELLGRTLQDAFGVIGQTPEEFDALFAMEDLERSRSRIDDSFV